MAHAFGAAFDNPDLIVACIIGDGESETCPLEGSWKSVNFLNPVRDGAVLPILHLNGYKISGPTVQGRTSDEDLRALYIGRGYKPYFVEGDDPEVVHQLLAGTLDDCYAEIRAIQREARTSGFKKHKNNCFSIHCKQPPIIESFFNREHVPCANLRFELKEVILNLNQGGEI